MAFIDGSVVTVALPAIQADLTMAVAGGLGRQRLHADARRAKPGRRLGRRSLWPAARRALVLGDCLHKYVS
jgi:hypothetical protein